MYFYLIKIGKYKEEKKQTHLVPKICSKDQERLLDLRQYPAEFKMRISNCCVRRVIYRASMNILDADCGITNLLGKRYLNRSVNLSHRHSKALRSMLEGVIYHTINFSSCLFSYNVMNPPYCSYHVYLSKVLFSFPWEKYIRTV